MLYDILLNYQFLELNSLKEIQNIKKSSFLGTFKSIKTKNQKSFLIKN